MRFDWLKISMEFYWVIEYFRFEKVYIEFQFEFLWSFNKNHAE